MAKKAETGGFDRRAALDNAQRFVQKNNLALAIEAYEQVVRHDPGDWSSANTLGDLLVRASRVDRAIREYLRIADDLASGGFLARAGAIYKKVLRLQPTHVEALRQSAALNAQRFATPVEDLSRRVPDTAATEDLGVSAPRLAPPNDQPSAAASSQEPVPDPAPREHHAGPMYSIEPTSQTDSVPVAAADHAPPRAPSTTDGLTEDDDVHDLTWWLDQADPSPA